MKDKVATTLLCIMTFISGIICSGCYLTIFKTFELSKPYSYDIVVRNNTDTMYVYEYYGLNLEK